MDPEKIQDLTEKATEPITEFVKDAKQFWRRARKPDQKEFSKIALATGTGFLVLGFLGFVVRLVFIPINHVLINPSTTYAPAAVLGLSINPGFCRFSQYQVEGRYSFRFVVKNAETHSIHLRLIPPGNPALSLHENGKVYRSTGLIAPGMSVTYEIIFIPEHLNTIHDSILIQTERGTVKFDITCELPPPILTIPDVIDCGPCYRDHCKPTEIKFTNIGGAGIFAFHQTDDDLQNVKLSLVHLSQMEETDNENYLYENSQNPSESPLTKIPGRFSTTHFVIEPMFFRMEPNETSKVLITYYPSDRDDEEEVEQVDGEDDEVVNTRRGAVVIPHKLDLLLSCNDSMSMKLTLLGQSVRPWCETSLGLIQSPLSVVSPSHPDNLFLNTPAPPNAITFNNVPVNTTSSQTLTVYNPTPLALPFHFSFISAPEDFVRGILLSTHNNVEDSSELPVSLPYLSILPQSGTIEPQCSQAFTLTFSPRPEEENVLNHSWLLFYTDIPTIYPTGPLSPSRNWPHLFPDFHLDLFTKLTNIDPNNKLFFPIHITSSAVVPKPAYDPKVLQPEIITPKPELFLAEPSLDCGVISPNQLKVVHATLINNTSVAANFTWYIDRLSTNEKYKHVNTNIPLRRSIPLMHYVFREDVVASLFEQHPCELFGIDFDTIDPTKAFDIYTYNQEHTATSAFLFANTHAQDMTDQQDEETFLRTLAAVGETDDVELPTGFVCVSSPSGTVLPNSQMVVSFAVAANSQTEMKLIGRCCVEGGGTTSLDLHAAIIEPQVVIDDPFIDFGTAYIGVKSEKTITIRNMTGVPCEFVWESMWANGEADMEENDQQAMQAQRQARNEMFELNIIPPHGFLHENGFAELQVEFIPKVTGTFEVMGACHVSNTTNQTGIICKAEAFPLNVSYSVADPLRPGLSMKDETVQPATDQASIKSKSSHTGNDVLRFPDDIPIGVVKKLQFHLKNTTQIPSAFSLRFLRFQAPEENWTAAVHKSIEKRGTTLDPISESGRYNPVAKEPDDGIVNEYQDEDFDDLKEETKRSRSVQDEKGITLCGVTVKNGRVFRSPKREGETDQSTLLKTGRSNMGTKRKSQDGQGLVRDAGGSFKDPTTLSQRTTATGSGRKRPLFAKQPTSSFTFLSEKGIEFSQKEKQLAEYRSENKKRLARGKGIAFQAVPSVGSLPPGETVVIDILCFSDAAGDYRDCLVCQFQDNQAPPLLVNVKAGVIGREIEFEGGIHTLHPERKRQTEDSNDNVDDENYEPRLEELPSLSFLPSLTHLGDLNKMVQIHNKTCFDVSVKWDRLQPPTEKPPILSVNINFGEDGTEQDPNKQNADENGEGEATDENKPSLSITEYRPPLVKENDLPPFSIFPSTIVIPKHSTQSFEFFFHTDSSGLVLGENRLLFEATTQTLYPEHPNTMRIREYNQEDEERKLATMRQSMVLRMLNKEDKKGMNRRARAALDKIDDFETRAKMKDTLHFRRLRQRMAIRTTSQAERNIQVVEMLERTAKRQERIARGSTEEDSDEEEDVTQLHTVGLHPFARPPCHQSAPLRCLLSAEIIKSYLIPSVGSLSFVFAPPPHPAPSARQIILTNKTGTTVPFVVSLTPPFVCCGTSTISNTTPPVMLKHGKPVLLTKEIVMRNALFSEEVIQQECYHQPKTPLNTHRTTERAGPAVIPKAKQTSTDPIAKSTSKPKTPTNKGSTTAAPKTPKKLDGGTKTGTMVRGEAKAPKDRPIITTMTSDLLVLATLENVEIGISVDNTLHRQDKSGAKRPSSISEDYLFDHPIGSGTILQKPETQELALGLKKWEIMGRRGMKDLICSNDEFDVDEEDIPDEDADIETDNKHFYSFESPLEFQMSQPEVASPHTYASTIHSDSNAPHFTHGAKTKRRIEEIILPRESPEAREAGLGVEWPRDTVVDGSMRILFASGEEQNIPLQAQVRHALILPQKTMQLLNKHSVIHPDSTILNVKSNFNTREKLEEETETIGKMMRKELMKSLPPCPFQVDDVLLIDFGPIRNKPLDVATFSYALYNITDIDAHCKAEFSAFKHTLHPHKPTHFSFVQENSLSVGPFTITTPQPFLIPRHNQGPFKAQELTITFNPQEIGLYCAVLTVTVSGGQSIPLVVTGEATLIEA
ncbi:hypothetical protein BLNAU_7911 [Blattamonas nauphoetae]|uniref:Uncharacterized protein n=1 Tax=Blattamonas nauphoetae TaxID=2049346 RepID=A0ABQ9Y030_9EUKA|nr:hypothetical protein BLNAU_7911 [Blattamonas nauphoetae]